jgi:hypothetical protein
LDALVLLFRYNIRIKQNPITTEGLSYNGRRGSGCAFGAVENEVF